MKKCKNCGTQFDGNCCPKCGTWADEEKICPKCGSKLNTDDLFCPKCGFSFKRENEGKKHKSFLKWIKSHLKIVIPVIIVLVTVIVLACTIPACIKGKDNGTYYLIDTNGEIDKKVYYSLKSGKWSNDDGESGTYETDSDKIIFYVEFMGKSEEWANGTLKDGVLKVTDGLSKDVYISEKHEHKFGKWETENEPSCSVEGKEIRECECGYKDIKKTPSTGHNAVYNFDDNGHWLECTVCKEKTTESSAHTDATSCSICGYPLYYTLETEINSYEIRAIKSGIKEVTIPSTFNNLPVTGTTNAIGFDDCKDLTCIRYQGDIASWCNNNFGSLLWFGRGKIKLYIDGNEITGNLIIPDGVKSIASEAFAYCKGLTDVTIPDSVMSIGTYAFYNCDNLIQSENKVRYVDKWVIDGNPTNVTLRDDTKGIADSAFYNCYMTGITLPDTLTYIGISAFMGCSSLTSVTIPDNVTYIGSYAFEGCSSLTTVTVGNGVTYIGNSAFKDCKALQVKEYNNALYLGNSSNPYVVLLGVSDQNVANLTVNEKTKIIYENAFSSCKNITAVTIPDGLTYIGDGAFGDCESMTSITIPNSVTYIGIYAFESCYNLQDINFNGTKKQWANIVKGWHWDYGLRSTIHCTDGIFDYEE